mmetsp:Transcript_84355/g.165099  ORF Transcript_84355/g.165099 Transcript_84355/m.165099 type:complete len:317 (-) Transcript_84355:93-1043(-)|eukprot:CAMPEP_0170372586 /NCGR_PEP_ID=MMETSP0117_2-20130122/9630_1 /TAXON_ID=400756 /ORGANISM="Durinskia baltica, Strain CSIRO CS-38" /LENGTH=316 /DNA_ID=CAMNT_0010627451 /DNA_START=40 /DNA_END=990 /DNA_ORIENTATION=-
MQYDLPIDDFILGDSSLDFDMGDFDWEISSMSVLNSDQDKEDEKPSDASTITESSAIQSQKQSSELSIPTSDELSHSRAQLTESTAQKKRRRKSIKATAIGATKLPNISRRRKNSVLVAFPSFDKCDSLLFFPYTAARLMNSGDIDGVKKLFKSYLHPQALGNYYGKNLKLPELMDLFDVSEQLHPDHLKLVKDTKVYENQVVVQQLTKFTESSEIYKNVAKQFAGTRLQDYAPANRGDYLRALQFQDPVMGKQFRDSELPDSDQDLVVYGNVTLIMTFEGAQRKIIHMNCILEVSSISPVCMGKSQTASTPSAAC